MESSNYGTYVGFWKRFVALIIDSIILGVVGSIIGGALGFIIGIVFSGADDNAKILMGSQNAMAVIISGLTGYVVGIVLHWLYFTMMESSSKQATLGKMALGIVVTDEYGEKISFARANGRYWSKIISGIILCVGYFMAGFTEKKQGLHDLIAKTFVVSKS